MAAAEGRAWRFSPSVLSGAAIALLTPILSVLSGFRRPPGLSTAAAVLLDLLMLASCGLFAVTRRRRSSVERSAVLIVGALGLYLLLSSIYAGARAQEVADLRHTLLLGHFILPYVWFFLAAPYLAPFFGSGRATRYMLAGLTAAAVWQIGRAASIALHEGARAWVAMVQIGGLNSNVLGVMLVLGLAIVLPVAHLGRAGPKWVIAALFGLAAIWTFSRSSYVALAGVSVAFFVNTRRGVVVAGVVALVLGLTYWQLPSAFDAPAARVAYTTHSGQLDPSSSTRLDLWRASVDSFVVNPVFGTGLGRSVAPERGGVVLASTYFLYSHNYYLTLAAQTGLVGVGLGAGLLLAALRLARKRRREPVGEQARLAVIGLALASIFGEALFATPVLVLFLILLAGVAYRPPHGIVRCRA